MGRGWNHVRQLGRSLLPFPILVLSIETDWKVAALSPGRLLHLRKRVLAAKRLRIEDVAARHNCPTPTRMTTLFQPFRQPPSRLCEELVPFRRTIAALSLRNSKEEKKQIVSIFWSRPTTSVFGAVSYHAHRQMNAGGSFFYFRVPVLLLLLLLSCSWLVSESFGRNKENEGNKPVAVKRKT